ncbi:LysR substrate-binding domain-containing protein [Aliikangiella sp. IMCC44359]|uniref:LysR substrate-binding domain-containing protein n=1 Tax=Aliikangiella sp. IMCC44359 TaxID=3459125 RepID=UPI00403B1680
MDKRLRHLNNLVTFESAARHQSYSKAATELFITQAAVSQQMRQLESSLRTKLFFRSGRMMQLTQSGLKLYHATQQSFDILLQCFNRIQNESIAGTLTVTSTQSFASFWLMPRLFQFSLKHPEIKIRIVTSNNLEDLQQGHIDLAIRFRLSISDNVDDGMHYEFVSNDYVYPACSRKLADEIQFQKPEDLLKCWLVSLSHSKSFSWDIWFKTAGVTKYEPHEKQLEVSSSDMALSAILSGHGVTLCSESIVSQYVKTGELVVPFQIKHPVSFKRYLVYNPRSAKLARLKVFMAWLQEEMKKE